MTLETVLPAGRRCYPKDHHADAADLDPVGVL